MSTKTLKLISEWEVFAYIVSSLMSSNIFLKKKKKSLSYVAYTPNPIMIL